MPRYMVKASIAGSQDIDMGDIEADSFEEAEDLAWELAQESLSAWPEEIEESQ